MGRHYYCRRTKLVRTILLDRMQPCKANENYVFIRRVYPYTTQPRRASFDLHSRPVQLARSLQQECHIKRVIKLRAIQVSES